MRRPIDIAGLFALAALLLAGCTTGRVAPSDLQRPSLTFETDLFGERPEIVEPAQIFALTDSQRQAFLDFFDDPAQQRAPAHKRVRRYLEIVTEGFDFHNDTRTAAEALRTSEGNCLTLALLTTALADLADVEVGYQIVKSTPVFEMTGSVVTRGLHVRSILYDPSWEPGTTLFLRRPGIQFDFFPTGTERFVSNLSHREYVAMYYSNIAGEAIAGGDNRLAFWLSLTSLDVAPDNVIALNTIAVAYRRAGDEAKAEEILRYGIATAPKEVSFLRNYSALLERQGRVEEAAEIDAALDALDDANPFDGVMAGQLAYSDGDYREAITHFRRAAKIAPYLHEAHMGMALAYLKLGNANRGKAELKRAIEKTQRRTTRSIYEAKLATLNY